MINWKEVDGNYSKEDGKIRVVIHPTGGVYRVFLNTLRCPDLELALPDDFKYNYRNVASLEEATSIGDKIIDDIKSFGLA